MLGTLYYHYTRFRLPGLKAAFKYRVFGNQTALAVSHRLLKHPVKVRIGTSDTSTFEQVLVNTEYDFNSSAEIKVIVDAGANIGLTSVLLANRYPSAKIYAIEPESSNFELLQENTNRYPNITTIQGALWDKRGTIDLVDPGFGHWGFVVRETSAIAIHDQAVNSNIRTLSVDSLLHDYEIDKIDILKMDIEGAELEVFQSADAWIDNVKSIIVELHDNIKPGCSQNFDQIAKKYSHRWQRGENVYISKPGIISAA